MPWSLDWQDCFGWQQRSRKTGGASPCHSGTGFSELVSKGRFLTHTGTTKHTVNTDTEPGSVMCLWLEGLLGRQVVGDVPTNLVYLFEPTRRVLGQFFSRTVVLSFGLSEAVFLVLESLQRVLSLLG